MGHQKQGNPQRLRKATKLQPDGVAYGTRLLLETPFSLPLWAHLPQLAFVQFPYRLDLVLGCIFPLIALAALRRPSYRIALCVFWLGWLLLPIGTRVRQAKAHHETVTAAQVQQHVEQGYPGIHEYAPASSEGGGRPQILPRIAPAGANPACAPTLETWQPEKLAFRSSATIPCSYQLDVLFYPDWRVTLDGQSAPILHQAPNGLILAIDTLPPETTRLSFVSGALLPRRSSPPS